MADAVRAAGRFLRDVPAPEGWRTRLLARGIAVARGADGRAVLLRPSSVLAKAPDDDSAERLLAGPPRAGVSTAATDVSSLRRIGDYVRLDVDPDHVRGGAGWSARPVASAIAALADAGIKAKPNHVYLASALDAEAMYHPSFMANAVAGSAAFRTTARPAAPRRATEPLQLPGRRGPNVLVLDTGLSARRTTTGDDVVPEHPNLREHVRTHLPWRTATTHQAIDDDDEANCDGDEILDVCAGHGTFVAGIVRERCPDAVVHVDGVLTSFGDGDDDSIEAGLRRALGRIGPDSFDVVILSLGATTTDDRFPPLAAAIRRVATNGRTVVVAAAGNLSTSRPSWPAAIPEVVGVGALHGSQRAWFSNFGGWVDACAPGVDVVSTFFCDAEDRDGDRVTRFDGWAAWNGTSFAAPIVAAAIAQDMYLHGDTAPDAWRRLSDWRRPRVPDLGVIVPG